MNNFLAVKIRSFFKERTFLDVVVNTGGNYLNVAFVAVYTFILFRSFTPNEYGIFGILFSIVFVLANILDFGLAASIYSYVPPLISKRPKLYIFLKSNFLLQVGASITILIICMLSISYIDAILIKRNLPFIYYFWTFIATALLIWQSFVLNTLFATKRFFHGNVLLLLSNISRLFIFFAIVLFHKIDVVNVIISLGVIQPITFLILCFFYRPYFLTQTIKAPIQRSAIKLKYSLAYLFGIQFFNLGTRIDLFMLNYFLPLAMVGFYTGAQKVVLVILTAVTSITQVLSPQFSNAKTQTQVKTLMKKSYLFISIAVIAHIMAILIPDKIYILFFTEKFLSTTGITKALSASYILYDLSVIPTLFFLYTIRKPIYMLIMNLIFLILAFICNLIFIQHMSVYGPAIAYAISFGVSGIYGLYYFIKEYNKLPK